MMGGSIEVSPRRGPDLDVVVASKLGVGLPLQAPAREVSLGYYLICEEGR